MLARWHKGSGQCFKVVEQLASGQVMSLPFIIPGLWLVSTAVLTVDASILFYCSILYLVALLNPDLETLANVATVLALVFCLLCVSHFLAAQETLTSGVENLNT